MNFVNKNPLIICICGKARSGKSTVCNYLKDYFVKNDRKVVVSPFTKYLKDYISDVMDITIDDDNKPRDLLQKISSDLIKGILNDKDFFIRRQIEDINFYSYFVDVILINDVRFPQEIISLKSKFNRVLSIGVKRENFDSDLSVEQQNDITEVSLDGYDEYDYVIDNFDFNCLETKVFDILDDIRKRGLYE